jgi:hypothetical protein
MVLRLLEISTFSLPLCGEGRGGGPSFASRDFFFSHGPHRVCHDAPTPRCSNRWPYEVRRLRRLADAR